MKNIIILKDIALNNGISSVDDVHLLTEGALAIFDDKNRMLTVANVVANMADTKEVRYVTKYGGQLHWSNFITREHATLEAMPSLAAVRQRFFIGNDVAGGALNLPGTLVAGMTAHIRIIRNVPQREGALNKQNIEYTVKTGDTPLIVITALVNKINARSDRFANASVVGVGVGIQLDTIEFGEVLTVGLDGILESADIRTGGVGNSIAINYGRGTFDQIEYLEKEHSVRSGNTAQVELASYWFKRQNVAVTGTLYDTYTINHNRYHRSASALESATNQTLIVAMPNGAAMQGPLEIIQTAIYGLAGGNEETGDDTAV